MKFKALLLACALFVSSTHPVAFAQDNVGDDSEFTLAESFLTQLGINDGIQKTPDEAIARDEFAAMVVRTLNMDASGYDGTQFTDLGKSSFVNEIYLAKSLGITNGTSDTTFSPDDGVAPSVAAKMLVTALDYGTHAAAFGGYPAGYLKVANSVDLLDGINLENQSLTIRDAYVLIYNTLIADKASITGIEGGDLVFSATKGRNLLTENFGFEKRSGVITTAGARAVNAAIAEKGKVGIDGELFSVSYDTSEYLGMYADIWYDPEDKTAHAIDTHRDNRTVVIEADSVVGFANSRLITEDMQGKQKSYSVDDNVTFIQNGRAIAHNDESYEIESGTLTLIDNDGDNTMEYVIAEKREYFIIKNINLKERIVYDKNSLLSYVDFPDDVDCECIITIDGMPASLQELAVGMAAEVFVSEDRKVCIFNAVSKTVDVTVAEMSADEIFAGGSTYKLSSYFSQTGKTINVGGTYSLFVAPDNTVIDANPSSSDGMEYAMFLGLKTKTGLENKVEFKLMTSKGKLEIYELRQKLLLNNNPKENTDSSLSALFMNGNIPKYQLIKYELRDGMISAIDTMTDDQSNWDVDSPKDKYDSLTRYVCQQQINFYQGVGTAHVNMTNAVLFRVPEDFDVDPAAAGTKLYDDDDFSVMSIGDLGTDNKQLDKVDAYDFNEFYVPSAVLIRHNGVYTNMKSQVYAVYDIAEHSLDSEGNPVVKLRVYANKMYHEFIMQPEDWAGLGTKPKAGDIVRFNFNGEGYVSNVTIDVAYNSSSVGDKATVNRDGTYVSNNIHSSTYVTGKVYKLSEQYIVLKNNSPVWNGAATYWFDSPDNTMSLPLKSAQIVIIDAASSLVRSGSIYDLTAAFEAGDENASFVALKMNSGSVSTVYAYIN